MFSKYNIMIKKQGSDLLWKNKQENLNLELI